MKRGFPAAAERAAEAFLDGNRAAERRTVIDRQGLQVVVFVQEKETKRILNAVVADVR